MSEPVAPPLEAILQRSEAGPRSIVDMALHRDPARPPVVASSQPPSGRRLLTRQFHNRPTPVPRRDWEKVLAGSKRQYRTYSPAWRDRFKPLFPVDEPFPRPALIYTLRPNSDRRYDTAVVVIEAYRMERLADISPADLILEGFDMLGQFKRYWKARYAQWGWRPDDRVSVITLRRWQEHDDEEQAAWLLRQLYGDWL